MDGPGVGGSPEGPAWPRAGRPGGPGRPPGRSWGVVVVCVEDCPAPAVDGATAGGSVAKEGPASSVGTPVTAEATGCSGTKAAEAANAATTAKVSQATSIRRQGSGCSARWRGVRGGMGAAAILVRLGVGTGSYGLSDPNEKLRSHTSLAEQNGLHGAIRSEGRPMVTVGEAGGGPGGAAGRRRGRCGPEGAGAAGAGRADRGAARPRPAAAREAQVIDLPGHTLLPGLIDCHTHLVGELQGSGIPA